MAKKTTLSNKELTEMFSNLTTGLLTNTNVETINLTVTFDIPKSVYDFVTTFASTGIDVNDVFSSMAQSGFNSKLEQLTSFTTSLNEETKQKKSAPVTNSTIPDMSKLVSSLTQIQQLASQLQNLEKVMHGFDDTSSTKKHNK